MGRRLRTMELDGGLSMSERACEHYTCRSCGAPMISANFVTGICIQVFASHGSGCSYYMGSPFERTRVVTCETCRYHVEGAGCAFAGALDERMEAVRTEGSVRAL